MQGAREYADMFESGQHGRLFFVRGGHARGRTFHIWALPAGVTIGGSPWSVSGAVEVYGITGGQPGWTETYGWLHRGKWVEDFDAIVKARQAEISDAEERAALAQEAHDIAAKKRVADLLANY